MKTPLLIILNDPQKPLTTEIEKVLEPFKLKEEESVFPKYYWDYWEFGDWGIEDKEAISKFKLIIDSEEIQSNICLVSNIKDYTFPAAVITPEGVWNDITDFGYKLVNDQEGRDQTENNVARKKWQERIQEIFIKNQDCVAIAIKTHS